MALKHRSWLMIELSQEQCRGVFKSTTSAPNAKSFQCTSRIAGQAVCDSAQSKRKAGRRVSSKPADSGVVVVSGACKIALRISRKKKIILQTAAEFITSEIIHQSFDFFPPLTPVTISSPKRKSGYLNPPMLGVDVRHDAPSTKRQKDQQGSIQRTAVYSPTSTCPVT